MRLNIGLLAIMLELGVLSCSPALAQYPAQRFGKVTAGQVVATTLTLPTGAAPGRVMTSDASGNGSWQSPSGPVDVGWRATSDGNSISSLYRQVVVGGPAVGAERLLVQGFLGWGYGADLIGPGYANMDGTFCFASSAMASWAFDNIINYVWQPTDAAPWVALKFNDGAHQVNRVTLYKYRDTDGQGVVRFPWDQFVVYGSNDSTNGSNGAWTAISPVFTVQHVSESSHSYDFPENTKSYAWLKLAGARSTQSGKLWLHEVEAFTYSPVPAKKFWVDANGNPVTDGTMTAAAITLTTNSQIATLGVADIQAWKNNPWAWTDDSQHITARYKNVVLGATVAGTERLKVIGFAGSGYSANQARLSGMSYYSISNATNQSWYEPQASFDGTIAAASGGSGNGWAPGGGNPVWLAFKYQTGVTKVINKLTLWREGNSSIPFESFSVYGSNDSTNGANGTWELVAGPFLPVIGGGQYWQTLSQDALFLDNKKAFNAYKIMGPVRSGRVLELEAFTYAPTPDKSFYVDAQGNPGTDGKMTAGTLRFTPLSAAPDSPTTGTAYFDSPTRKLRVWDGSVWQDAW